MFSWPKTRDQQFSYHVHLRYANVFINIVAGIVILFAPGAYISAVTILTINLMISIASYIHFSVDVLKKYFQPLLIDLSINSGALIAFLLVANPKANVNVLNVLLPFGAAASSCIMAIVVEVYYKHQSLDHILDSSPRFSTRWQNKCFQTKTAKLWFAARYGNEAKVRQLLSEGANVNAMASDGKYANTNVLWWSCFHKLDTLSLHLINHGANLKTVASSGKYRGISTLWWAIQGYNKTIVEKLLPAYEIATSEIATSEIATSEIALLNHMSDTQGKTAITWAIHNRHLQVARHLINNNADLTSIPKTVLLSFVNYTDRDSGSAIQWALCNKHWEMAKLLVGYGADIEFLFEKVQTRNIYISQNDEHNTLMSIFTPLYSQLFFPTCGSKNNIFYYFPSSATVKILTFSSPVPEFLAKTTPEFQEQMFISASRLAGAKLAKILFYNILHKLRSNHSFERTCTTEEENTLFRQNFMPEFKELSATKTFNLPIRQEVYSKAQTYMFDATTTDTMQQLGRKFFAHVLG